MMNEELQAMEAAALRRDREELWAQINEWRDKAVRADVAEKPGRLLGTEMARLAPEAHPLPDTEDVSKLLEHVISAVRAEAGRERAVRELEALAEVFGVTPGEVQAKDASVSYGLAQAACVASAACAKEARRRAEEIAKEGK